MQMLNKQSTLSNITLQAAALCINQTLQLELDTDVKTVLNKALEEINNTINQEGSTDER